MVGCTAGASSKLLFSIVAHTLYPASAVLCLYFAIRARCYTSALAPCRMQEPFPPHPFLFLPFSHPSLSLSLSLLLSSRAHTSFSPPYGRPRCSCSHGRRCSCCQILRRSVRCWLLLAPMLLLGSFGTLVRRKRNCPPRSSRRFIGRGRLSNDELPATLGESIFLQEYR